MIQSTKNKQAKLQKKNNKAQKLCRAKLKH